ncbi:MAG TPA: histidine phosphatase family protein [Steroidobacteraceae bacterium]|nr:histidine phosphatase family protein [Steroidobacteraceae bacterium]
MGELVLVRHGQASFFGADYDELSAVGREQARALGRHWAGHGVRFDSVYVGPRRRHRDTLALVAEAYAERGLDWPAARELEELDEHDGVAVLKHALGRADAAGAAMEPVDPGAADREQVVRRFFGRYREVMRDWAGGALEVPGVEPWAEFRQRSRRALDVMCVGTGRAVAFTSGGLMSSAAGWLLGLDEERVIELSAVLRNTGLCEVRYSGSRRSLVSFNALPHLPDPAAATAV